MSIRSFVWLTQLPNSFIQICAGVLCFSLSLFTPFILIRKCFFVSLFVSLSLQITDHDASNSTFPYFIKRWSIIRPQRRVFPYSPLWWELFCPPSVQVRSSADSDTSMYFFPLELCTLPTISCSWPFLVASPVFITIGSGLLYLLDTNTSSAKIIGFQILAGVGVGFGMQNSLLAMQ